ncbi:hypothetical protein ACEWY4_003364 [Coilia grayii]|uniref:THD domain-containing protein n=1 Tax=Coilia grayii TaxID=363190 RepID=A0ABD1KR28_9TELE
MRFVSIQPHNHCDCAGCCLVSSWSEMAEDDATTPASVPMLGGQEGCRPVAPDSSQPRRQCEDRQTLLFYMAFVALCGVIVEACIIYRLHTSGVPNAKDTDASQSDSQAGTKTPGKDGVMLWEAAEEPGRFDEIIMQGMKYENGRISILKEGYYSVYSKLYFKEPNNHMILHTIVKITTRYPKEIVLLRSKRFRHKGDTSDTTNSFLEGVFHLIKDDAIFVKVNNHTEIILEKPTDNYFGVYML